jgi:CRISPR/Cas system CSM-associated protein Csm3 (group 7 of RAMP superfamily)
VLPTGTRIPLRMTVDCTKDIDARGEIRALLEALMRGDIRIGAAKTRGLGRVILKDVHVERFEIGTRDGVLAFLQTRGATQPSGNKQGLEMLGPAKSGREHPRIRIDIDWAPKGPVMVKAGADGAVVDMMPLVTANGAGGAAPVIPGASSKGALRQHSERILATVLQEPVAADKPGRQRFINQLMRLDLVETLYGAVKKRGEETTPAEDSHAGGNQKPQPGLGALRIDDCLAVLSLSRTEMDTIADGILPAGRQPVAGNGADEAERRERTRTDALKAAVNEATLHSIDIAHHVAIDRWTGGAADGALFTAAEPRLKWNPLRIEIDKKRLVPASGEVIKDADLVAQAAVALLLLTLKDMANGLVPLGFGVNRGYGEIDIRGVDFKMTNAPADHWAAALDGVRIAKRDDGRADFTLVDRLKPVAAAWEKYIDMREHAKAKAAAEAEARK